MVVKLSLWKLIMILVLSSGLYLSYFSYGAVKTISIWFLLSVYIKIQEYNYSLYYKGMFDF